MWSLQTAMAMVAIAATAFALTDGGGVFPLLIASLSANSANFMSQLSAHAKVYRIGSPTFF